MELKKITRLEYIEALESGEFKQAKGALYDGSSGEDCFCGLGVAYKLKGYMMADKDWINQVDNDDVYSGFILDLDTRKQTRSFVTPEIMSDLDMDYRTAVDIYIMNDSGGADLKEIAHYLRSKWDLLEEKNDKTNT
jgi:hypothetical protein